MWPVRTQFLSSTLKLSVCLENAPGHHSKAVALSYLRVLLSWPSSLPTVRHGGADPASTQRRERPSGPGAWQYGPVH